MSVEVGLPNLEPHLPEDPGVRGVLAGVVAGHVELPVAIQPVADSLVEVREAPAEVVGLAALLLLDICEVHSHSLDGQVISGGWDVTDEKKIIVPYPHLLIRPEAMFDQHGFTEFRSHSLTPEESHGYLGLVNPARVDSSRLGLLLIRLRVEGFP